MLAPNARINRARTQPHKRQVSRMKATLFALRLNELLGAPSNISDTSERTCLEYTIPLISRLEEAVKLLKKQIKIERPEKEKVTREQALKRVKALPKRKEKLIATIREGKNRNIHS